MNKKIRLTEAQLHNVILNSAKKLIREFYDPNSGYGENRTQEEIDQNYMDNFGNQNLVYPKTANPNVGTVPFNTATGRYDFSEVGTNPQLARTVQSAGVNPNGQYNNALGKAVNNFQTNMTVADALAQRIQYLMSTGKVNPQTIGQPISYQQPMAQPAMNNQMGYQQPMAQPAMNNQMGYQQPMAQIYNN